MSTPAQKWAILIGVSRYPLIPGANLAGPENDVKGYKAILEERFGFAADHIAVLLEEAATRAAIRGAIAALTDRVGASDIVVIAYSGHGSQRLERLRTDAPAVALAGAAIGVEPDGLQETIVPYDSGRGVHENRDIADVELHELLVRLTARTPHVTVILDCCHSAGALRDALGNRVRGLPVDSRPRPPSNAPSAASGVRGVRMPTGTGRSLARRFPPYVLIAACRSDEKAYELTLASGQSTTTYGALSYFLQRELLRCAAGTSARELLARVSVEVNRQRRQQHPYGEGCLDGEIFGVGELPPPRGVRVQERSGCAVTLGAGLIHGVTTGSRFAVSAAGAAPTLLLVTEVGAATAQAVITAESAPAACTVGAYAIEVAHALGAHRFMVDLAAPPQAPCAAALRRCLLPFPQVVLADATAAVTELCAARVYVVAPRTVVAPADPVPQLGPLPRPTWAVVDHAGELLLPPLPADGNDSAEALASNLNKLACLRALEVIENPDQTSALHDRFVVQLLHRTAAGNWEPAVEHPGEGAHFHPRERFAIAIRSRAAIPVYIALVDLSVLGSISLFFPPSDAMPECLLPGGSFVLGARESEELSFALPEDALLLRQPSAPGLPACGSETLLCFFSATPIDFSPVEQGSFDRVLGRLPAPLRLLAMTLAARERDFDLEPDAKAQDWTVVRKRVLLTAAPKPEPEPSGGAGRRQGGFGGSA